MAQEEESGKNFVQERVLCTKIRLFALNEYFRESRIIGELVPRSWLVFRKMENDVKVIVKWGGKEYEICDLTETDTVSTLKNAIHKETGVLPERQKLLNLKLKGKTPDDDCQLSTLKLKPGFKVMMMGSLEKDIEDALAPPENMPEVINDLDFEEEEEVSVENKEVHLAKIEKRVREYHINIFNEPRPGKKLLVLDIDYTLFDHRSVAETGYELMRPYLHEFLTSAYQNYDIVIWSATSMKWIEEKMKLLGVSQHPAYKIMFYLDSVAMITVQTPKYGLVQVKPLGVIWGKFDQYSPRNTIMFDDIRRNFLMNPANGLKIRPFKHAHLNRDKDNELLRLAKYLQLIAGEEDLSSLDHRNWEKYRPKHKRKERSQSRGSGDPPDGTAS